MILLVKWLEYTLSVNYSSYLYDVLSRVWQFGRKFAKSLPQYSMPWRNRDSTCVKAWATDYVFHNLYQQGKRKKKLILDSILLVSFKYMRFYHVRLQHLCWGCIDLIFISGVCCRYLQFVILLSLKLPVLDLMCFVYVCCFDTLISRST